MVKFLIIRFSSIGDIVLTTPVIRCLKTQVEDAEIHFVTKKKFSQVLIYNPYIDKLHLLDDDFKMLIRQLRAENFDYVIDLHHNLRSLRIKCTLKRVSFSFDKLNIEKWIKVRFGIDRLPDKHIVDRYLETTRVFSVENDGQGLNYFPGEVAIPENILPSGLGNYLCLVVGGGHFTKQIPESLILDILQKINFPVVFLGGKEDQNKAASITEKTSARVYNLVGKLDINQSAGIIENCQAIITPDTGLMHIAAAFHKKIISVWGNTIPEFGMYPYMPGNGSEIFEIKGLHCRPCSKIGFKKCPKGHFRCMLDQQAEKIALSL